jgi:hypothetical protein
MTIIPDPRIRYYTAGVLAPGRQPALCKGQLKITCKIAEHTGPLERTAFNQNINKQKKKVIYKQTKNS